MYYTYVGEDELPESLRHLLHTYRRRREGGILDFFAEVREHIYAECRQIPVALDASSAPDPCALFYFGRWWVHPVVAEAATECLNAVVQGEITRHGRDAAALSCSGAATDIAQAVGESRAFLDALQKHDKARTARLMAEYLRETEVA